MSTPRLLGPWAGATGPATAIPWSRLREHRQAIAVLALAGLVVFFTALRLRSFGAGFWIDDGIAVGIASHPLTDIPSVLREDGSPPLYYVLLHGWMALFGRGEAGTYALSLLFALACVPVAGWCGRRLLGPRAGWTCAVLAASSPFLTVYAGQARMYTLVVLLSLVATTTFVLAFLRGVPHARWGFALSLAALLYTHGWGLFFGVACAVALLPCLRLSSAPRRLLLDAAVTFGLVALAYAPWLPTVVYQAGHTAAPWSLAPTRADLVGMAVFVTGAALVSPLSLSAVVGWVSARERGERAELEVALVLAVLTVGTVLVGFLAARVTATWAPRYVAVAVGPAALLLAGGSARAGVLGLACLGVSLLAFAPNAAGTQSDKSNVEQVLRRSELHAHAGDLVVVTQPEAVPVVRYYLGPAATYASTLGPVGDPQVMDWRDASQRLRSTPAATLQPLLDRVPAGGRVVLVRPKGGVPAIAWPRLIALRTRQWLRVLKSDPRFRPVYATARGYHRAGLNAVEVLVLERRPAG